MTTAEQLAVIQIAQFFTDLRTKLQAIGAAMTANAFTIDGQISTLVNGVQVKATFYTNGNVHVLVGLDDNGHPLYEWNAPSGWVS